MTKGLHKNSLRKGDNPHQWMIDDAKMELIQQIKAEIERLKTIQLKRIQEGDLVDAEPYDKNEAYNELLSFLSTLQEHPVDFPTTDEEMKEFLATHPKVEVPERYKKPDWIFEQPVCEGVEDILLEFYDEYDSNVENRPIIPRIYAEKLARHFAQWGAEHLKK